MNYAYVAYTQDRKLVQGKIAAMDRDSAAKLLVHNGYQVLSLKTQSRLFSMPDSSMFAKKVKLQEIILFSRQLALLLESGTDIVTSLELLQEQTTNPTFKKTLGAVANDIRGGSSLSAAMSKHPKVFSALFHRVLSAGEQGGNMEAVLRNMADFLSRMNETRKKLKSAMTYPVVVAVVAVVVVSILMLFVMPTFTDLYRNLGVNLPTATKILITLTDFSAKWGIYILGALVLTVVGLVMWARTPNGRYNIDKGLLKTPVIGRIIQLSELSRACQTIALLFRAGLPLPEIMAQAQNATSNKIISENLGQVQKELIRGEGLSGPMKRRKVFLPMMVAMVGVGEETGKLDDTLSTVAHTYDMEADDKIKSAVELIQPAMTVIIGLIVAFIAVALVGSMYSMYGQLGAQ
ncbi:type IV pilus assembly protein PilC [Dehalogenimonas formicexedens]|uniref:Type IV pilus assembly protein PilC n=1 Tax=Dehalogenimonas formicexedens TaxID=1839801 RepID=A0A1P8F841_9CHLR|nr:type II secretion system F family protein [Dehalogenimonas formicexedens]APV44627.1 type IV pilus assembly protein PilC [Dehalogenimonas formicexedens]